MNDTVFVKKLKDGDLSKTVQWLAVSGSPTYSTSSILHWCFMAGIDSESSVKLDMQPGAGIDGLTGFLGVTSLQYSNDQSALTEFPVKPSQAFTVGDLVQLLLEKGYARYKYDSRGMGCLHWCVEVVRLLEGLDLVEAGSTAGLRESMAQYRQLNPAHLPIPDGQGTFYD